MSNWDSNWVLAVLTAIYVVATIAICWANWLSASAAKKQTAELIRQYKDSTRGRIAIRFDKKVATDRQIVLRNIGKEHAEKVHLSIDEEFMDGLNALWADNILLKGAHSEINIAPDQEFWFFVGFGDAIASLQNKVAHVTVDYIADGIAYKESAVIDFSQYTFISEVVNHKSIDVNGHHFVMG